MRSLIRFVLGLIMPIVLLAAGAGMAGLGLDREWNWLVWAGLIVAGAGIVWGLFLFFLADSGSFLD
ncbi:MAG: hypothetical protein AAFY19_09155 [Pseudomonadota bacterium]